MLPRLILAAFLLGHAAVHGGYLSPRPAATIGGPTWPFDLTHSWMLSPLGVAPEALRALGYGLFAVTLAAFALAAIAALGFLPAAVWSWSTAIGAASSLAMLLVFFHPWLAVGVTIDVIALWVVLALGWAPTDTPTT
jgi:hypothetical protein